jgi:hypothetical protein
MSEANRRDFFRVFGRRTVSQARELAESAAPLLRARSELADNINTLLAGDGGARGPGPSVPTDSAVVGGRPDALTPTCCLSPDDVDELARAEGLGSRVGEIRSLIRRSARILRRLDEAEEPEAWLDLAGGLAIAEDRPSPGAVPDTVLLAQVALSAPALQGTPLAGSGWLAVFVERAVIDAPTSSPALRANVVRLDLPAVVTPTSSAMTLSAQLVLPRVWSEPVQAMDLDGDEHQAFVRLREWLAQRQGVEVEHGGGTDRAYHRLLGYPDETTGMMPTDCAVAAGEGDWRLLAQISVGTTRRVYVWIAGDGFERAVAFAR